MDELLLKIDVLLEAVTSWTSKFITILLKKECVWGVCLMAIQIWKILTLHFLLGKLIAHISMLKALRSSSIKKLLGFD